MIDILILLYSLIVSNEIIIFFLFSISMLRLFNWLSTKKKKEKHEQWNKFYIRKISNIHYFLGIYTYNLLCYSILFKIFLMNNYLTNTYTFIHTQEERKKKTHNSTCFAFQFGVTIKNAYLLIKPRYCCCYWRWVIFRNLYPKK